MYHYAANNPVKYTDPDGRDIYNINIIGAGGKLVIGGGVSCGVAFDSEHNFAITINFNAGIGVEASVDTLFTPSYSITKGVNISDLKHIGPYAFSRGYTSTASVFAGIIYDFDTEEIAGISLLSVGGGIDANITAYLDLKKVYKDNIAFYNYLIDTLTKHIDENKDNFPENIYKLLIEFLNKKEVDDE